MNKSFFIRRNGKYISLNPDDILYIEGCRNYLKIVTEKTTHLVLITFKWMEELLSEENFVRIHKSYIVAIDKISEFCSYTATVRGRNLPIGNNFRGRLEKQVTIITDETSNSVDRNTIAFMKQAAIAG